MPIKVADRVTGLPPYLFAEIDRKKQEVRARGVDVIDLGVGDPDRPTPQPIVDALCKAAQEGANHRYPSYVGMIEFRKAAAEWMKKRYGVAFDAADEVMALIGSKEGIANIHYAFVNPGDVVLIPIPGYPVYRSGTLFAGGRQVFMPLLEENGFWPDFSAIREEDAKAAKLMHLNYPNNPTNATASLEQFAEAVAFCKQHDIILCHDAAYAEVYFDNADRPHSIFEVEGTRDVAIEFHSLSKTFNMTGWRLGWACGNKDIVAGLGKIKTNQDSGAFNAVQLAGIEALTKLDQSYIDAELEEIRKRRDVLCEALSAAGIEHFRPKATFYVWAKNPGGVDSATICSRLLEEVGVVVTPGTGFGSAGEGYFRFSLTAPTERILEAVERLKTLSF